MPALGPEHPQSTLAPGTAINRIRQALVLCCTLPYISVPYRTNRDDGFLASAWELVRELQASHVLRRVPPGPDPWSGRPGYGGLIERVVGLAGGAQVLVETRGTPLVSVYVHFWHGVTASTWLCWA